MSVADVGVSGGGLVAGQDVVLPRTRWLALFIIPFLVVAAAILWIWPHETGRLFAWPIRPPMTAMLLGSAYLGGIWFFTRVARARHWHRISIGFLPVATFSTLLCVATVLHWDRFTHDHVAFWAWAALYFATPPLVIAAWLANRGQDPARRERTGPAVPLAVRAVIGLSGLAAGAVAAALFVVPEALLPHWPWTLSPLTARVVSAIFAMQAVAFVGIALDGRWGVARVMFEAQLFTTPLIVLAVMLSRDEFASRGASAPGVATGLGVIWLAMLGLFVWMHRRAAQDAGPVA